MTNILIPALVITVAVPVVLAVTFRLLKEMGRHE